MLAEAPDLLTHRCGVHCRQCIDPGPDFSDYCGAPRWVEQFPFLTDGLAAFAISRMAPSTPGEGGR